MTDKIMDARRAKFEHEYSKLDQQAAEHLLFVRDDGQYGYHTTRVAWACYNAALDSLCVELPEPFKCDDGYPSDDWIESNAQTRAIGYCRAAIHAAGVKTK